MPQVIPCIVLAQPRQTVQHRPIRHYGLQPQTQIACIAIAQYIYPACIGCKVPPYPRRAFRSQRQRKEPPRLQRRRLHICENRARLGNQHIFFCPDLPDRRHPLQRQDHRQRSLPNDLPADQPGAAPVRHNPYPLRPRGAHQRGHFFDSTGYSHNAALPRINPARLFQIARVNRAKHVLRQPGLKRFQHRAIG